MDTDENYVRLDGHFELKPVESHQSCSQPGGIGLILCQAEDMVLQGIESGGSYDAQTAVLSNQMPSRWTFKPLACASRLVFGVINHELNPSHRGFPHP